MPEVTVYATPHEEAQAIIRETLIHTWMIPEKDANLIGMTLKLFFEADEERTKLGCLQLLAKHSLPEIKAVSMLHSGEVNHNVSAEGSKHALSLINGLLTEVAQIKRAEETEEAEILPTPEPEEVVQ